MSIQCWQKCLWQWRISIYGCNTIDHTLHANVKSIKGNKIWHKINLINTRVYQSSHKVKKILNPRFWNKRMQKHLHVKQSDFIILLLWLMDYNSCISTTKSQTQKQTKNAELFQTDIHFVKQSILNLCIYLDT